MTKPQEKRTALDAFIEHKTRIDAMPERLQAASADHFEPNPEEICWGDAGFLADIAKKHLSLETLETRNSDGLDFHDVAVWCLKNVLKSAYEAGLQSKT